MKVYPSETRRFELLFDEPLTDRATGGIAERLRCQRVARLMRAWQNHRERKESFGRLSAAVAFFRGLEAIAQEAGNGVLEFIDRWPVSYFVSRNYQDNAKEELAYGRLAIDLLYSTLPNGTSPLAGLTFATPVERDGSLLALEGGGRLFIRSVTGSTGSLIWSCSARTATVTNMSDLRSSFEIELPLPPADMPLAAFTPNAVANGFQIPILDDGANVLLTSGYSPDHKNTPPSNNTVTDKPLTLADSLSKAHDAIAAVWPDVIPWARALVPAVADMGRRDPRAARLSGSFAPGEPIYLTQVTNPLFHAEDLIHEVQHLRFALTVPAEEWFGRWHEEGEIFISPYRPDLRPLAGIHVGLHAFVAVTEFGLRTINQPRGQVALSWLYDTHLRNLFAFHTIAKHEKLSSEGRSYYREVGCVLANQHRRIKAMVRLAQREQILSSLRWPIRPVSEGETVANPSIDIRQVASTDEIVGLIPPEFDG
jgi:HEXXH motif-containing protein